MELTHPEHPGFTIDTDTAVQNDPSLPLWTYTAKKDGESFELPGINVSPEDMQSDLGNDKSVAYNSLRAALKPVGEKYRTRDQRSFYDRGVAPVLRSIPAYVAGAVPDILGLLSYVPGPVELVAKGYMAATGEDPFGMVAVEKYKDVRTRQFAEKYGSKAQQLRFQEYIRAIDTYADDELGFKPFEATVGTDMTPEARGIWEEMMVAGLEYAVSGPLIVAGVTVPAKILQGGARFIYAKMAKDSVKELGEAALNPANTRSLIDKAYDAYNVFKQQGRRNIAWEMAYGAVGGPMTVAALHALEKADPDAAGWVKMLTAIGSGIGGPLVIRGATTSLLQGIVVRIAARHVIDPIFRPGFAAATFVQQHLGGVRADRAIIASTARLLEEAIEKGRHVHEASGLAFTTPELARTEANILKAEIQIKRERLSQETSPEVKRRLEQEIQAGEATADHLNITAQFYEDVLESAARDQTPGAAHRFYQNEAKHLVQRREQFFNYIEGDFKRAYDELDFNGKPGGTPEEHRIDLEKTRENPAHVPEFEKTRRTLVMEADPRGVESSELLWLDPQTRTRVDGIQQDLSAKMDEALAKAQDAAQGRVDRWKLDVQSYLANRGLKSVDDLSKTEKDLIGDVTRGIYDDAGREWRAFTNAAYKRIAGIDTKVTENIVFPRGSRDPSNDADLSGMTVEEWVTSRLENLSPGEAFNLNLFPPQFAQLAGKRSLIAWINRARKEEAAAGKISNAEEAIPNLERRRDDAIAQRDEVEVRLNEQRAADRSLSEANTRELDAFYMKATANLDDAGKQAVAEFFNGPNRDWVGMSPAMAKGLAPKGLETVFSTIAKQKKRIAELGEGVTSSAAVRALDNKMEGFALAARKAQNDIDDITNKAFGLDSEVTVEVAGRLTARTPEGAVIRNGTSANDVVEFISELAKSARVEKALNGYSTKYRNINQIRETVEQLLDSKNFPDLDTGQLNLAKESDRIRRAVDDAQGPVLEKDRSSEVKVEVEDVGEAVLPSDASLWQQATNVRLLQEATAQLPDFVTVTWGADGIPVARINEATLDGSASLLNRPDSPFEMITIGQGRTPFELRVKTNVPATKGAFKIAEGILLERMALKFQDGVDSKGLESFRTDNKAAIKFLEDNGQPFIPDLVKDADSLALQLDALRSFRQDKTRRLLTEMERNGLLQLNGLQIDDFVQYIGNRRKIISEGNAFSEVLNADPGFATENLFNTILKPGNAHPKTDIQEFMSLLRGSPQALKGFQASIIAQLFARSLSGSDALLKTVGDLKFKAFDPVKFRELLNNPRVRIIIQEAFPDNPSLLGGLEDMAKVAFETSSFTTGSGAQSLVKTSEAVSLTGWAFLGRITALGAANQTKLVNALWAAGAGGTLGRNLGQRITGAKVKDIVIDAARVPEKSVELMLKTADQKSGFWGTAAKAAMDVINVPGAVLKRPAATLPVLLRGEKELDEAAPGPQASVPLAQPLSTGQQPDDAYRVPTGMERNPAVPPSRSGSRRSPSLYMASRGIVPASSLYGTTARPLGPRPTAQGQPPPPAQGQIDPQQLPRMRDLGMPFFEGTPFNKGGIVSIQRKPRQLVG